MKRKEEVKEELKSEWNFFIATFVDWKRTVDSIGNLSVNFIIGGE